MKLDIFQSRNGDCLLLESRDGKRILCDGGMAASMRDYVRDELGQLRTAGKRLDYVYVSHIDQDHISGVLQLLNDELEWRVYDHHKEAGDSGVHKPSVPRPPNIGGIWHNAFRDVINDNSGEIESLLAAATPILFGTGAPKLQAAARELETISLSVPEALKVSKLASQDLLGIPLNTLPGSDGPARLLLLRDPPTVVRVGSMTLTVVGPTSDELKLLREGWNNWLRDNREMVKKVQAEMRRRIDEFSNGGLSATPFDLRDWNGIPDYKGVTAPNIASLMFLVEEDGKRLLLTGDSQQDIILKGLEQAGYLEQGYLHLDVLKVQHHASENNVDLRFCRQVSARNYVFCGNGEHGNPEPSVIETIYESRLGSDSRRARAPEADGEPFTFWFSTTAEAQTEDSDERTNFEAVEELVRTLVKRSKGRLRAKYNKSAFVTLSV